MIEIITNHPDPSQQAMEIAATAYHSEPYPLGRGKYDDISAVVVNI